MQHILFHGYVFLVTDQVNELFFELQKVEGMIKEIDRHKRKAYLEMEMFGRCQRVEVGLEITMKMV